MKRPPPPPRRASRHGATGAVRELLMFDLDGTLLDTRRDLATAVNRMRQDYRLPPLPVATVAGYVGDGFRVLVRRALQKHRVPLDEAVARCARHYRRHLAVATRPYPGVPRGLARLQEAGFRLALISNKPTAACRRLVRHFGWARWLDAVTGGDSVSRLKPHPEALQHTLGLLDVPAGRAWMIGDHKTDLEAAQRAGIRSVFVTWGMGLRGGFRPARVFHSFDDLTAFFLRRAGAGPR